MQQLAADHPLHVSRYITGAGHAPHTVRKHHRDSNAASTQVLSMPRLLASAADAWLAAQTAPQRSTHSNSSLDCSVHEGHRLVVDTVVVDDAADIYDFMTPAILAVRPRNIVNAPLLGL